MYLNWQFMKTIVFEQSTLQGESRNVKSFRGHLTHVVALTSDSSVFSQTPAEAAGHGTSGRMVCLFTSQLTLQYQIIPAWWTWHVRMSGLPRRGILDSTTGENWTRHPKIASRLPNANRTTANTTDYSSRQCRRQLKFHNSNIGTRRSRGLPSPETPQNRCSPLAEQTGKADGRHAAAIVSCLQVGRRMLPNTLRATPYSYVCAYTCIHSHKSFSTDIQTDGHSLTDRRCGFELHGNGC